MKKNYKVLSAIALIGILMSTLTACGKSAEATNNEKNPKTITIGYQAGADDKMLVKEKGWFEEDLAKQGITLKYVSFESGRDINDAILAKSIDFGDLGDPPVAIGVSNNIPYEVFWIDNLIGDSEALAVKNSANINSIKDLKGKKIATTVSSTSHYTLLNALKLEGLDAKDVQIIDLKPADIVAAWQRGDIDAAYTWEPNLSKLYQDGKKLISSKDLASKGIFTSNINIVRKDFADKYPQLVSLYVKELIKAQNEFKNNQDAAADVLAKALQIDKAEAIRQANENVWLTPDELLSSKYLGSSSKKGDFVKNLKSVGDFLVDQNSLSTKLDISEYEKITNPKYLEDALKN